MSDMTLFHDAELQLPNARSQRGWLLVREGRIARLGLGAPPPCPEARPIDACGQILAPGLIDLHTHGALGHDTMDASPDKLRHMARFYARHGVTGFLATTMAASGPAILAALHAIRETRASSTGGAALLGAHVEGPYLDMARRGAQAPEQVRLAQPDEYRRFFDTGVVKLITLSPDAPENLELISFAVAKGCQVALGHTRCSYEAFCQAVALGASHVTHLFNGMEPLHHREPGALGAALALDSVRCELIADNIHVHPAVLKLAVRAKGVERIVLVTDAMRGAGMPDGDYELGGQAVSVQQGVARLANGALAGSTLTMERAVRNIKQAAELSLAEALRMASHNPAQALGLQTRKGSLEVGKDADLILLNQDLSVTLTMVAGEIVYPA